MRSNNSNKDADDEYRPHEGHYYHPELPGQAFPGTTRNDGSRIRCVSSAKSELCVSKCTCACKLLAACAAAHQHTNQPDPKRRLFPESASDSSASLLQHYHATRIMTAANESRM